MNMYIILHLNIRMWPCPCGLFLQFLLQCEMLNKYSDLYLFWLVLVFSFRLNLLLISCFMKGVMQCFVYLFNLTRDGKCRQISESPPPAPPPPAVRKWMSWSIPLSAVREISSNRTFALRMILVIHVAVIKHRRVPLQAVIQLRRFLQHSHAKKPFSGL